MWWVILWLAFAQARYLDPPCPELCFCDNKFANCQNNELSQLPADIYNNVIKLDLSYNFFEVVPTEIKQYTQLQHLNMSHNRISILTSSLFEGLTNLQILDLSFNLFRDWKDIYSATFQPTKNLQFLDFSSNPLRSIHKESKHLNITSLVTLRLTNCSMKTIPVEVFNRLGNLRELHLADNPLTNINESFQLNNLRFIDLRRCHLNYIDENVFAKLTSLEELHLEKNIHLKQFNSHSDHLVYLFLSGCMLEKIPSGRLRNLVKIDISNNNLKTISANSFMNFYNLQVLNLSVNAITSIHEKAFQGLKEVTMIDLSFNKLVTLNERLLNNNSALISLNLTRNYLRSLDNIRSKTLKMLIASYCEIHELNKYSLYSLPSLVNLNLERNFFSSLPDGMIAENLAILDINSCRLKSLNNRTFENMFALRQINLANNAMTTIDPSYFPRAFNVVIKDNPWRCDCSSLKNMFQWVTAFNSNQLKYLICNSPEKVAGKTWYKACNRTWFPPRMDKTTMWYYSLAVIILMAAAFFALFIFKKVREIKESRIRLQQEARRREEQDALRHMQELERQTFDEESRNAPDPRELQSPPSYTEALMLPRLAASYPSLDGSLHSFGSRPSLRSSNPELSKKRRRRRRRKSEEERRASRLTLDSDSSDETQSQEHVPPRRKPLQVAPLESDF